MRPRAVYPATGSRAARPRAVVVLAAAAVSAALLGCSVEKHYKILSFFFDGVPDPNNPGYKLVDGRLVQTRQPVAVYTHEPYAKEQCASCHQTDSNRMLGRVKPSVCLDCHEEITTEPRYLHGPVAALACVWCHMPHDSQFEHLLRTPPPQLCLACHDPSHLTMEVPEHGDPNISCLDCHSAHGGDDPAFLHPGVQPRAATGEGAPAEEADDRDPGEQPGETPQQPTDHRGAWEPVS